VWRDRFDAGLVARADRPDHQALAPWAHDLGRPTLCEHESSRLVREWGLPTPQQYLVEDIGGAVAAAEAIGYPVVVKADGPEISHKSDIGAVRTDVYDAEALCAAYDEVLAAALSVQSREEIHGVLVCEKVTGGIECIVGLRHDPLMGMVILFGIGGTGVEIYGDVMRQLCPLTRHEATEMIRNVRGSALLSGSRSHPSTDFNALADLLVRISEIGVGLDDQLAELDLNPVMVMPEGKGVLIADALAILGAAS
jgi:acyl-CoA synthetase (NDP forming)